MVKAYLKYIQHDVIGGVAGNESNITTCQIDNEKYIVSGCNEVVNFINAKTGEIKYKIYDKEAQYGFITQIYTTSEKIAIGFSKGSVLIYSIYPNFQGQFEQLHQFSLHRSRITQIQMYSNDTYMVTSSTDTSIIVYDLISDQAIYKLLGHNDVITSIQLLSMQNALSGQIKQYLVSGSKDGFIKIWDLEKQMCVLNISDQFMSKVECFTLIEDLRLIVVGSSDNILRLFQLDYNKDNGQIEGKLKSTLKKDSSQRCLSIQYQQTLKLMIVSSRDNKIEIYKVNVDKEENLIKKLTRQEKRKALKRKQEDDDEQQEVPNFKVDKTEILNMLKNNQYDLSIHFTKKFSQDLNTQSKLKSMIVEEYQKKKQKKLKIFCTCHVNQIYEYQIDMDEQNKIELKSNLGEIEGHRMGIRQVVISQNDRLMVTSSFDCFKLWNISFSAQQEQLQITSQHSVDYQNVLCVLILPGNKNVLVGTKEGMLSLYDIGSSQFIYEVGAHQKEIWELSMHSNPQTKSNKGSLLIASCSSDQTIKFWTIVQSKTNQLKLQLQEKIETTDEVMGVKFTPDGKYFVFSLLDQTMKICYVDSLKLFLNLYGHKLPILSFDISSDNELLVSSSADKNIKIWGMDFGDIHKSIFAHSDSITCVKFIKDTHYIMSCSKDQEVKFYDGDTYDEVFVFDNFFGEVWSIALSSIGDFFVVVSADKGIRVWRQTDEQVFVSDEREEREEKQMLKEAEEEFQEIDMAKINQIDPFSKDKVMKLESMRASKKTAENMKYGDDLIEAIEMAEQFKSEVDQYEIQLEEYKQMTMGGKNSKIKKPSKPQANFLFNGRNIFQHVQMHLKAIKISELENALRFLNFKQSTKLLYYLENYIRNGQDIDRASRCAHFIIQSYQTQILGTQEVLPVLKSISMHLRYHYQTQKDDIGFNVQGLKIQQKEVQNYDSGIQDFNFNQNSLAQF